MTNETVISAKSLDLTFQTNDGPVHALKDVNLNIAKGDFISFIGPSGCGKTTILRVMADLENPTDGTITINGVAPNVARENRAVGQHDHRRHERSRDAVSTCQGEPVRRWLAGAAGDSLAHGHPQPRPHGGGVCKPQRPRADVSWRGRLENTGDDDRPQSG